MASFEIYCLFKKKKTRCQTPSSYDWSFKIFHLTTMQKQLHLVATALNARLFPGLARHGVILVQGSEHSPQEAHGHGRLTNTMHCDPK